MRPNPTCAGLSAALAALVLAGCGGGADKAGGERTAKPTVLTLANGNDNPETMLVFAAAVAKRSGGTLRIAFKNRWRRGELDYEAGVIRDVGAGKADLGWAGTRAFDDVGVSSFDALHAPLLIDSYPLERKALESPLVPEMLVGLGHVGVVGLGILPGPLRKPLGVARLVRPDDYKNSTIAFQSSEVAAETLRALGARAAEIGPGDAIDAYDGVEQQIGSIAGNRYDNAATNLTANVSLWPRLRVVFANPKALERLDEKQRAALDGAARAALPATLAAEQQGEREGATILCRRGVEFVTAQPADLAALRRAVQPVYDRLEQRAQTKAAIARIRSLRSEAGAPPDAPACAAGDAAPPTTSGRPTPVDGVYRSDVTLSQLRRTRGYEPGENNPGNVGHFRMDLRAGRFKVSGSSDHVDQTGTFSVKGNILSFEWNGEGAYSYRWSLYRGALTMHKTGTGPTIFAVHPWRRTRDASSVGARTPLDGVYRLTTTREESAKASDEPVNETYSENYGTWRFMFDRGQLRYTQSSEGARRWTHATYTAKDHILTVTITTYGGEAPNGAAEKTGEIFTYRWSLYRDRLTLSPVAGAVSPPPWTVKPWRRVGGAP